MASIPKEFANVDSAIKRTLHRETRVANNRQSRFSTQEKTRSNSDCIFCICSDSSTNSEQLEVAVDWRALRL